MGKINLDNEIEALFLRLPDVVNFDRKHFFEVKPGRASPIFVNIKNTLCNFEARTKIVKNLSKLIDSNVDCICGIESGGAYYAGAVADTLKKPLVLFRRQEKGYAEKGKLVGRLPNKKSGLVAVIDDVIVSGKTITPVIDYLREQNFQIKTYAIFSYGLDSLIEKNLKTKISALANMNALCKIAKEINFFDNSDISLINKFVEKIKKKIS